MSFKEIKEMNWAWSYETEKDLWIQFDCSDCLLLGFGHHTWEKEKELKEVTLMKGSVNLETMEMQLVDSTDKFVRVKRSADNHKIRPNA